MTESLAEPDWRARCRSLETALSDYIARYGLTDRARAALAPDPTPKLFVGLTEEIRSNLVDGAGSSWAGNR
jgi:hypothetical protein